MILPRHQGKAYGLYTEKRAFSSINIYGRLL